MTPTLFDAITNHPDVVRDILQDHPNVMLTENGAASNDERDLCAFHRELEAASEWVIL